MKKKTKKTIWAYVILVVFGFIMVYPLIWMFFATFKDNKELFGTTALLPSSYSLDAYLKGWKGSGQYTFTTFFINSFKMVIPAVFFTIASCSIVAYGFARFKFVGKKLLFGLMISTLMLPNAAVLIPRYLLFRNLGWLNTFKPFWMPALLAAYPFFIFMLIQFLRGIPKDLDESAKIDGANSFVIFKSILLPLMKPALFSVGLMQFMWVWNDFYNPLIYINSVKNYPLALGVRMVLDTSGTVYWNQVLAMALVSILPLIILFFFAQRYFIEGIATTGMKG